MTTFMYTTTSDVATVKNPDAVLDLVSQYYFTVEPSVVGSDFSINAEAKPNAPFDVYHSPEQTDLALEEFFEQLSEYLTESFEVQCLEVEGVGKPAAWKWTVSPDGEVVKTEL